MAYVTIRSGHFLSERKKLLELNSRLIASSIDFIDAAFWLMAGDLLPQAVVMLDNAIEVALKGELERIHKILIASTKELGDFKALKSLLRDAFLKHPSAGDVEIPEFDIERTIYFEEAFDRVAELYPSLVQEWRSRLIGPRGKRTRDSLHALRNDIVHYGGDPELMGRYTEAVVEIALPFLANFLNLVSENKISLAHLLKEWIYREVEVARLVLFDLRSQQLPPECYAIKTLQHHMLWANAGWPSPLGDQHTITDRGQGQWDGYVERQRRHMPDWWNDDFAVRIFCPVCDSHTSDGSFVQADVLLDEDAVAENILVPVAFNCFVCGLLISPEERFLAKHFVGEIPTEVASEFLKAPPR